MLSRIFSSVNNGFFESIVTRIFSSNYECLVEKYQAQTLRAEHDTLTHTLLADQLYPRSRWQEIRELWSIGRLSWRFDADVLFQA
jgi:hypothetical protein